ncbi:MAG TPA: hypothetical protein VF911_09495, partial [Thermoanaerobaculia bacterium]
MKKALALLLLIAGSAFAQTTPLRDKFPSDYKPSPCAADADAVCESFPQHKFTQFATAFRGFDMHQEWVDEHWDEMRAAFKPYCAKMGNCFTVKDNDWVYCLDLLRTDFIKECDRFPAGTKDRDQCTMFAVTYYVGLGAKTKLHAAAQSCMAKQPQPATRTLAAFVEPEKISIIHNGKFTVHAYDAETHIPVRAFMSIESGTLKSLEGSTPKTGYANEWKARLKRVPNAQGHKDVVAPVVTLEAPGYEKLTFAMPIDVPTMTVEITPSPDQWKVGMNVITVTARDAATGKPVFGRVMAEDMVLGETNKP